MRKYAPRALRENGLKDGGGILPSPTLDHPLFHGGIHRRQDKKIVDTSQRGEGLDRQAAAGKEETTLTSIIINNTVQESAKVMKIKKQTADE